MPLVTINQYYKGNNTEFKIQIPPRVTITGNEDHFERAFQDANMIVAGMQALTGDTEEKPRYRIVSLRMD